MDKAARIEVYDEAIATVFEALDKTFDLMAIVARANYLRGAIDTLASSEYDAATTAAGRAGRSGFIVTMGGNVEPSPATLPTDRNATQ